MTLTKQQRRILVFITSILLAILSFYSFHGWFNIIPWSIVTLLIGYLSDGRRDVIINGAIFGYFLFLVYIMVGYGGKTDLKSLITFAVFSVLFSLIGSAAGIGGSFIGNVVRNKIKRSQNSDNVR